MRDVFGCYSIFLVNLSYEVMITVVDVFLKRRHLHESSHRLSVCFQQIKCCLVRGFPKSREACSAE